MQEWTSSPSHFKPAFLGNLMFESYDILNPEHSEICAFRKFKLQTLRAQ